MHFPRLISSKLRPASLARYAAMAAVLIPLATLPVRAQMGSQEGAPAMAGMGRMVRGTVTAVAGDKVTLKTDAGETFTVAVSPNTRLMRGRDPMKLADIKTGDGIGAVGEVDAPNKTVHAMFVTVIDAEQVKKARENLGKTYIAGKVTAIDELKLTIQRADGVSQVIAVDEDTSFRRGGRGMQMLFSGNGAPPAAAPAGAPNAGGESITLADIKVGDTVAGPGALRNGVFVPTQLGVSEPGQGGGGRRRRQGADGATAAPPAEPK